MNVTSETFFIDTVMIDTSTAGVRLALGKKSGSVFVDNLDFKDNSIKTETEGKFKTKVKTVDRGSESSESQEFVQVYFGDNSGWCYVYTSDLTKE